MRLSVAANGEVRLSIPPWLPYDAGLKFAESRASWIQAQQTARPNLKLKPGQAIGKAHHLLLIPHQALSKPVAKIKANQILVNYPEAMDLEDELVQKAAHKACLRALRVQSEQLLPHRLRNLAAVHGFDYKSVKIKQLKSRWGSCDHQQNIVLNLFLMQLPWDCIDYVLLHELVHTKVLKHGPAFWTELERVLPTAKSLRKIIRSHQPALY